MVLKFAEQPKLACQLARNNQVNGIWDEMLADILGLPVGLSVPPEHHKAIYEWLTSTADDRDGIHSRFRTLVGGPRRTRKATVVPIRNAAHVEAVRIALKALNPAPLSPESIMPAMTPLELRQLYIELTSSRQYGTYGNLGNGGVGDVRSLSGDGNAISLAHYLAPEIGQGHRVPETANLRIQHTVFHNIDNRKVLDHLHETLNGLIFRPHEGLAASEDPKPEIDRLTCEVFSAISFNPQNAVLLEANEDNAALFLAKETLQANIDAGVPFNDEKDWSAAFLWKNISTDYRSDPPIRRLPFAQGLLMCSPVQSAVVARALEVTFPTSVCKNLDINPPARIVIVVDYELIQQ